MFNPTSPQDRNFHIPRQCVWLKLNGSWPLGSSAGGDVSQRKSFAVCYTVWSWYVIVSVGITIAFQTAFLINTFGDIIRTTENCCTTFMGALNFVRLLHLRLNQEQFKQILEQFANDIWIVKQHHPRVADECGKQMNTFRIMTILLSCLILMYCVLPVVELFAIVGLDAADKPFPYKMLFPYDAHHGLPYVLTYVFTAYAGICVVTTLFAEDSIFGFFITYTCGQFKILHERIATIVPTVYERVTDSNNVEIVQREYIKLLNGIAYRHNKLIQFGQRLEQFFNPILLVNFLISSVLICVVGFQLATGGKAMFIGDLVKFIIYILSALSQLYILCWNGDTLIQQSTETAKHLYACKWEGESNSRRIDKRPSHLPADRCFRQNLQIMIMCSQRPVKITAYKFSTLSLQSFTAILSTSMSYFTLLRTLFKEHQDT